MPQPYVHKILFFKDFYLKNILLNLAFIYRNIVIQLELLTHCYF